LDVLAVIYLLRCDGQSQIRNDAVHVWKTVVANTPRTLRATLPRIAKRILQAYSQGTISSSSKMAAESSDDDEDEEDDGEERKMTGARAVADLTRKLGEKFIEGILPILRTVFEASEEEEEQIIQNDKISKAGAALSLAEIFDCAEESTHEGGIVSPKQATLFTSFVEICLSSPNADIQDAGGVAFKAMYRWAGGKEAAVKIVPDLLRDMDRDSASEEEKTNALNGLRVALKAQPNILAVALPKLAAPPITPDKAKTLGALASVAGPALPPHLDSIIPRLLDAIEGETNLEEGDEIVWTKRESFDDVSKFPAFNALRSIITAAPEDCGAELLSEISDALTELAKTSSLKKVDEEKENAKSRRRAVSSIALADFAKTFSGYDDFVDAQVLVKTLTLQFSDKYKCARDAAWGALNVVVSTIQKDELMEFVDCCHASVRQCREQAKRLHKQKQISPGGESTETDSLSSLSPSKYTIIPALALPRALEAISKRWFAVVAQRVSTRCHLSRLTWRDNRATPHERSTEICLKRRE